MSQPSRSRGSLNSVAASKLQKSLSGKGLSSVRGNQLRSAVLGDEIALVDQNEMAYELEKGDLLLLASDAGSFVNGVALPVDGA